MEDADCFLELLRKPRLEYFDQTAVFIVVLGLHFGMANLAPKGLHLLARRLLEFERHLRAALSFGRSIASPRSKL